jgi:hypothetical protein
VNTNLGREQKWEMRVLLQEFTEMPGLGRELVEHRLPIKPGFRPHRQPTSFNDEVIMKVRNELDIP